MADQTTITIQILGGAVVSVAPEDYHVIVRDFGCVSEQQMNKTMTAVARPGTLPIELAPPIEYRVGDGDQLVATVMVRRNTAVRVFCAGKFVVKVVDCDTNLFDTKPVPPVAAVQAKADFAVYYLEGAK